MIKTEIADWISDLFKLRAKAFSQCFGVDCIHKRGLTGGEIEQKIPITTPVAGFEILNFLASEIYLHEAVFALDCFVIVLFRHGV